MNIKLSETTQEKFLQFIESTKTSIREEGIENAKNLAFYNSIIEFNRTEDLDALQDIKERVLLLDEGVQKQFKIVDFFYKNNATTAPQYLQAIDAIKKSPLFTKAKENQSYLADKYKKIEELGSRCDRLLSGDDIDVRQLASLIDIKGTPLSEDERIEILTVEAYESCKEKTAEIVVETELFQEDGIVKELPSIPGVITEEKSGETSSEPVIQTIDLAEESLSPQIIGEQYFNTMEEVNKFIADHHELIAGQNQSQLNHKKMIVDIMRSNPEEFQAESFGISEMEIPEIKLAVSLLYLKEETEGIEELYAEMQEKGDISQPDLLETVNLLTGLNQILNDGLEAAEEYKTEEVENKTSDSKVVFLVDEDNKPFFDYESATEVESKRMNSLLEKFENGNHDYENKARKHSKVLTRNQRIDYDIFLNRSSEMCCSYVRLERDLVMVLTMGPYSEIYDKTISLTNKYNNRIKETIDRSKNNSSELISEQEKTVGTVKQTLVNRQGGPKL